MRCFFCGSFLLFMFHVCLFVFFFFFCFFLFFFGWGGGGGLLLLLYSLVHLCVGSRRGTSPFHTLQTTFFLNKSNVLYVKRPLLTVKAAT